MIVFGDYGEMKKVCEFVKMGERKRSGMYKCVRQGACFCLQIDMTSIPFQQVSTARAAEGVGGLDASNVLHSLATRKKSHDRSIVTGISSTGSQPRWLERRAGRQAAAGMVTYLAVSTAK